MPGPRSCPPARVRRARLAGPAARPAPGERGHASAPRAVGARSRAPTWSASAGTTSRPATTRPRARWRSSAPARDRSSPTAQRGRRCSIRRRRRRPARDAGAIAPRPTGEIDPTGRRRRVPRRARVDPATGCGRPTALATVRTCVRDAADGSRFAATAAGRSVVEARRPRMASPARSSRVARRPSRARSSPRRPDRGRLEPRSPGRRPTSARASRRRSRRARPRRSASSARLRPAEPPPPLGERRSPGARPRSAAARVARDDARAASRARSRRRSRSGPVLRRAAAQASAASS